LRVTKAQGRISIFVPSVNSGKEKGGVRASCGRILFLNGFNPRISFEVIVKKTLEALVSPIEPQVLAVRQGNVGQWNKNHSSD
jgi:hypothetical protein